ncbi:DUF2075 domain-containing protein [Kaistella flava (ex Peng et al. 2021)]|uniref:DUF2075 domain-containing protein n=1 Tax=Kaistella flava (ex Peng et al. 2021) TaxID=2038776 RepID=A0A7M2Y857_9FLAO|nr:DUF2075 domain-containing protein [Kaistella flava (ex Peng et al. 2021)]QOW10280.1 DUF2075 domain-containing protein [Kaistella flava (ex Peng et al. 2021)]
MAFELTNFSLDNYLFDKTYLYKLNDNTYFSNNFPIVYIIYDTGKKIAYVGESANGTGRISNHLSNPLKNHLKYIFIISSPLFNKSATLDIESNLIKYIAADGNFSLLNGNAGLVEHNYYQRNFYFEVFENIWEKLKLEKVVVKDILAIDNSDLFKYSPYKSLSIDQKLAVREYLQILLSNEKSTTFIKGSAGTGKTVVAVYLMKLLLTKFDVEDYEDNESEDIIELELAQKVQNKYSSLKIAFVVPMKSLRETLKNVFANIRGLKKSMVISPIEASKNEYDILLVDESHRLKRRKSITGYGDFDKTNRRLGFDNTGTELDWILVKSKNQLFFYDSKQSVRPADVLEEDFELIRNAPGTFNLELKSQLRVQGGLDYIKFVHALMNSESPHLHGPALHEKYDLRLYNSLAHLVEDLGQQEKKYGLCRLVAGYSWEWTSRYDEQPDTIIDGIPLFWNRVPSDWINSTKAMNEMGCIHTTQGYDLNYSGVIFGNEIIFNKETNRIEIDKAKYFDKKGKQGIDNQNELHQYILNIYTTLMFRGIKGTYVYVCDDNLRKYFAKYINVH